MDQITIDLAPNGEIVVRQGDFAQFFDIDDMASDCDASFVGFAVRDLVEEYLRESDNDDSGGV